jgi:hypothetical protein
MTAAARVLRLAHLLLSLARYPTTILALCSMSACVLPIAPDFQDPLSSPNYSPFIISSSPPAGSIVTGMPTTTTTFRVTVSDPNVGDDLHIRWLVDYPPLSPTITRIVPDTTISHSADGQPIVQDAFEPIGCSQQLLSPTLNQHQVMVLIADRPFETLRLDQDNVTKLVDDAGFVVSASWILTVGCR